MEKNKTKIIKINVLAAFSIKGLSLLVSLATMPTFISFFGDRDILGVWFTALSILNWVLSFDLGIGNGLRNHLTVSISQERWVESKTLISSSYASNGLLSLIFLVCGLFAVELIDWNFIFGIEASELSEDRLRLVVGIVLVAIILQLYLRLASFIAYALQMSYANNLIALITNVTMLAVALIAPKPGNPEDALLMLAMVYMLAANLPLLGMTLYLFFGPMKQAKPSFSSVESGAARRVMTLGGIFFICQIEYMILINTNEFFISHFISPAAVVEYQSYYKLFSLIGTIVTLAISPIWSLVTQSLAEGDFEWLIKLYRRMKRLGLLSIPMSIVIALLLPVIFPIWLGDQAPDIGIVPVVSFVVFGCTFAYQSVLSTVACGMGKMKVQLVCYSFGCLIKIAVLTFALPLTGQWSLAVLVTGLVLAFYCVIQQIALNQMFKNLKKEKG